MSQERLRAKIVQDEIAYGLPLPSYGREGDVCRDVFTAEDVVVPARGKAQVRTGLRISPPPGYYFRVVGKGSSAWLGFTFTLEIVDPGYTGELILLAWNMSDEDVVVKRGKAIAQLELLPVTPYEWDVVTREELGVTERGEGRLDSTRTGVSPIVGSVILPQNLPLLSKEDDGI